MTTNALLRRLFGTRGRPWRWLGTAFLAASGCSTEPPFAASRSLLLTAEEGRAKPVLEGGDPAAAIEAMRLAAPGHRPEQRAVAAADDAGGVRWSDLEIAVSYACDDAEAAVVETIESEDGNEFVFRIRTIEDWPGRIVVRRVDPPQVYRAEVSIGRFPGDHADRCDRLFRAIDTRMRSFGRKREYPGD